MVKVLPYEKYFDRIYGGWVGKCIGGAIGAHHVLTRYLRAKRELLKTLELRHPSLISDIAVDHAIVAIKNPVKIQY